MPAKAGIQAMLDVPRILKHWIPACAGMTPKGLFADMKGGCA